MDLAHLHHKPWAVEPQGTRSLRHHRNIRLQRRRQYRRIRRTGPLL